MSSMILIVILAIAIVAVGAGLYNRLVRYRNRYKNAFAQIDVQLKRRYDLIPNLVETAKGYMAHEKETLNAVIQARNQALGASQQAAQRPGDPDSMKNLSGAENALTGALGRLLAIAEAYPNLKADTHMSQLMEELTSTENKVAFARQAFNDAVMVYNTACQTFPSVLIANAMGFREAELFEIEAPREKEVPKVSF